MSSDTKKNYDSVPQKRVNPINDYFEGKFEKRKTPKNQIFRSLLLFK